MYQFEPPRYLADRILNRIYSYQQCMLRMKLVFLYVVVTTSAVAIVPTIQSIVDGFYQSGFYQYLSLLLSDTDLIPSLWQNFALSLFDSMPIFGIIIFLTTLLALLWSTGLAISNSKKYLLRTKLI